MEQDDELILFQQDMLLEACQQLQEAEADGSTTETVEALRTRKLLLEATIAKLNGQLATAEKVGSASEKGDVGCAGICQGIPRRESFTLQCF